MSSLSTRRLSLLYGRMDGSGVNRKVTGPDTFEGFERSDGGVESAHAMDSAAGWCGGAAEEDGRITGGVGAAGGAEDELARCHGSAGEIAAGEVGVPSFELRRGLGATGEYAVAEAGSKALDLGLDGLGSVERGAVGDVAVAPGGVAAGRGTGGVGDAGLDEKDERGFRVSVREGSLLGGGNLIESAADVDGGGAAAGGGSPGDGFGESPIHFEGTGAGAEVGEAMEVGREEAVGGDAGESLDAGVEEGEGGGGDFVERLNGVAGDDFSAERTEVGGERIGEGLRAATDHWPAGCVSSDGEDKADCCAERGVERHDGVSGTASEEGLGAGGAE